MRQKIHSLISFATGLILSLHAQAASTRIAIVGDSITFDGRWATRVEAALRSAPEYADAEIVNFGLSSETVSGLSEPGHAGGQFPRPCLHERLDRILGAFKPTLVLACYGMNDGIYLPLEDSRSKAYQEGIVKLKTAVEDQGGKIIFISPPLHNADKTADDPNHYDAVLDAYGDWLVSRRTDGWQVIDIRPDLKQEVAAEKNRNPKFIFANDGVHPGDGGHRFMADSITRQLWPLLNLPGAPKFPNDDALGILRRRSELLKLAWLTKTRHIRPGVPAGLPMDEAEAQAKRLMEEYQSATSLTVSEWNGFERSDFTVAGRAALLVRPKTLAPGNPWIWRTEFFGHEPQGNIALLGKGFHVAYIDLQNLYGAPVAIEAMDRFHDHLAKTFGLSQKVVLEGFSRGGLFAFNWAAHRPANVAGLYVDAPVCDFKSWPGGKGKSPGSPVDWQNFLNVYELTEEQAIAYAKNPIDTLALLANAGVSILAVVGDADKTVPVSENIDIVEKKYQALGGKIQVIRKPGYDHHPHSLPDPAPIVDFVLGCYR